jgi:hypothetical protein
MLDDKSYHDRVAAGKAEEKNILNVLRSRGIKIDDPSPSEDMYDKIDGWMEFNGKKVAIQVKFRESGDDVIFEIVKDIDRKIPGRDMVSKADYYLIRNRRGVIQLFSVDELKKKAQVVQDFILSDLAKSPQKDSWGGDIVQVKLRVDKAHGNRKLIAYFNPRHLKSLGEWK